MENSSPASLEPGPGDRSPFGPGSDDAYRRWRDSKLADYPSDPRCLMTRVADPEAVTVAERQALVGACRKTNLAFYSVDPRTPGKCAIRGLARVFGLERLDRHLCADRDGIATLRVESDRVKGEYIPYTDKALNWHTDGYYYPAGRGIRSVMLHCAEPAARGGENAFLDPELAYIGMRDEEPELVSALMQPDCLTIPANQAAQPGGPSRGPCTGPVFFVEPGTGTLGMRYTARKRHVVWKDDAKVREARALLERFLAGDNPAVFRWRFEAGQGVLCNNVLHTRNAFDDGGGARRTLYRARFLERIEGT